MSPGAHVADFGSDSLAAALAPWRARGPLQCVIALSGGADSAALLAAAARLAVRDSGLSLRALHIDHGLLGARPLAAAAAAAAAQFGVPFEVRRIRLEVVAGESLEAAARAARYAAFAAELAPGEALLVAHHREDQAETLLLQLLRGAGLRGLAAMPVEAALGAGLLLRPLLAVPRQALRSYVAATGVPWHEDPMNADPAFDRNYLRNVLWPPLSARWPAAAATLSRSAAHLAAAQQLLDESSAGLCAQLQRGEALPVAPLRQLAAAQRRELLRYWLHSRGLPLPSTRRLLGFEREFLEAGEAAQPHARWDGAELWRFDGCLHAFACLPPPTPVADLPLSGRDGELLLGAAGRLGLAWREGAAGEVVAVGAAALSVGLRRGGERLQRWPGGPARAVKDWLREARVPPWVRERALFVRAGEELVALVLPGQTWVAAPWCAPAGEKGLVLDWPAETIAMKWCAFVEPEAPFR